MMRPIEQIEQLIERKQATYYCCGVGCSIKGKYFCTIWGVPSKDTLTSGHGETIDLAMRDALAKVNLQTNQPSTLPGLTNRPFLPGMTR